MKTIKNIKNIIFFLKYVILTSNYVKIIFSKMLIQFGIMSVHCKNNHPVYYVKVYLCRPVKN